jgi:hypothetical protein
MYPHQVQASGEIRKYIKSWNTILYSVEYIYKFVFITNLMHNSFIL